MTRKKITGAQANQKTQTGNSRAHKQGKKKHEEQMKGCPAEPCRPQREPLALLLRIKRNDFPVGAASAQTSPNSDIYIYVYSYPVLPPTYYCGIDILCPVSRLRNFMRSWHVWSIHVAMHSRHWDSDTMKLTCNEAMSWIAQAHAPSCCAMVVV